MDRLKLEETTCVTRRSIEISRVLDARGKARTPKSLEPFIPTGPLFFLISILVSNPNWPKMDLSKNIIIFGLIVAIRISHFHTCFAQEIKTDYITSSAIRNSVAGKLSIEEQVQKYDALTELTRGCNYPLAIETTENLLSNCGEKEIARPFLEAQLRNLKFCQKSSAPAQTAISAAKDYIYNYVSILTKYNSKEVLEHEIQLIDSLRKNGMLETWHGVQMLTRHAQTLLNVGEPKNACKAAESAVEIARKAFGKHSDRDLAATTIWLEATYYQDPRTAAKEFSELLKHFDGGLHACHTEYQRFISRTSII